jgi:hypothetical protein
MPRQLLADSNFNTYEIQNAVVQVLATAPTTTKAGLIYFDSGLDAFRIRNAADTGWIDLQNFVVVSTDANNDITAGTDGGAFVDVSAEETTTMLSQAVATGIITYTDEDGGTQTAIVVSTDLNNDVSVGTDGGAFVDVSALETLTSLTAGTTAAAALTYNDEGGTANVINLTNAIQDGETTTTLTYNAGTTTLTYTDEDGVAFNIDLSALAADIFVNGGSFNAATTTLTLSDNDGGTADVTIDLSTLRSVVTPNLASGSWSHNDGNGTVQTIVSTSADANNQLTIGSDGGSFLAASKYKETFSTVGGTPFVITHNLNETRPLFQLYFTADGQAVEACVQSTGANTLEVTTSDNQNLDITVCR